MNKAIDITNVVIKTQRLILRPFRLSDLDDFYEYAKVEGVGEMAGWIHHENKDVSKGVLDHFIEGKHTFALEYNLKVIGSLGIEFYNEQLFPEFDNYLGREIGFVLSKDYWGNGLMREACEAVIKYLFHIENLDFILCAHFDDNMRSMKLQQRLGFKEIKRTKYVTKYGVVKPDVINIMYNPEKNNMNED